MFHMNQCLLSNVFGDKISTIKEIFTPQDRILKCDWSEGV